MDVYFTGPISESDKWDLLSRAEMVLCPSILEGFGIVAVEAPLAGSPVLVSDSTALPELAGTSDAIIETFSSRAWAEAASKMFNNTLYRTRVLNVQIAHSQKFREREIIDTLIHAYRALLS
jgi:glycosyltransferase involved in cell wall biosynthesis